MKQATPTHITSLSSSHHLRSFILHLAVLAAVALIWPITSRGLLGEALAPYGGALTVLFALCGALALTCRRRKPPSPPPSPALLSGQSDRPPCHIPADIAPLGYLQMTSQGRCLHANDLSAHIFGYADAMDFMARLQDIGELLEPKETWGRLLERAAASGRAEEDILCHSRKGNPVAIKATAICAGRTSDHDTNVHVFIQNISRLRELEKSYELLFEHAPIGIMKTLPEGRYLAVNPAWSRMLGYASPETMVEGITDIAQEVFLDPEERGLFLQRIMTAGEVLNMEIQVRRSDGATLWTSQSSRPVCDATGNLDFILNFSIDITKQKVLENSLKEHTENLQRMVEIRTRDLDISNKALRNKIREYRATQQALIDSESKYRTLFDDSADGVIVLDSTGKILEGNPAARELLGVGPRDFAKTELREYLDDDGRMLLGDDLRISPQGRAVCMRRRIRRGDGYFHAELTLKKVNRFIIQAIIRDATTRMEFEEALIKAKEYAEKASSMKSMFLANVSHELRTPLTGILGMTEIALSSNPPSKLHNHLMRIKQSGETLLSIINDVLDFAKIESGKLTLHPRDFNLKRMVHELQSILMPSAESKGIRFIVHLEDDVPVMLRGDRMRLKQVLLNLAANAVKFTHEGEVALRVELGRHPGDERSGVESSDSLGRDETVPLHFIVQDSGIGIPEEKLEHIFESFEQVDPSHSRLFGGSGLGLTICRSLTDCMGGTIRVESDVGKGSTFHVYLSLAHARQEESAKEPPPPIQPLGSRRYRILIVEDFPVNQEIIREFMERNGHFVTVAANGSEALKLLDDSHGDFDLICMDIQMPIMDGYETTRRIRQHKLEAIARLPILAVTAHAMKHDQEKCILNGMDDFLAKPFTMESLLEKIEKLMSAPPEHESSAMPDLAPQNFHTDYYRANLARSIGESDDIITKFCKSYLHHSNNYMQRIQAAIAERKGDELKRLAHSLKSSFIMLGAEPAREQAQHLERIGQEGDWNAVDEIFSEFQITAATLRTEVEQIYRILTGIQP